MELKDLPTFLLKPLPRSRVRGHVQSMALFNLRTDAGFQVELAICEHVTAIRRYSATTRAWEKWVDKSHDDHAAAKAWILDRLEHWTDAKRGYYSLVSTGMLLPLNETDVRHLRSDGMLPRAMLEYGSELYGAITAWRDKEIERATPPAPAAMPAPGSPPPAVTGASSGPASTASLDEVLGKLRSRTAEVS